jgi:hypothetical protein
MISDYTLENITTTNNLIFSIKFKVDDKEYDYYVKIGRYDYGKYNKLIYEKLNKINMDACCYTQERTTSFSNDLKYVYESIFYEKMTEIESTDVRLKNKIVRLNNRGIIESDCIYFLINKKKYKCVLDCKKIVIKGNPICKNIKDLFSTFDIFNNTELYYYITENDKTYKTLDERLKENKENKENENKFFKLAIDICEDLRYLYDKYDFIHWDLHDQNILINDDLTKYKIFDFDKSQLTYKNIKYKSCVYFDSSLKKIYIRFSKKNIVYNANILNSVDYYSLFLQKPDYKSMFLTKCIGEENSKKIIDDMEEYFKDFNYSNLSNNDNLPINVKDFFVLKKFNNVIKIIGTMMLNIYFKRNIINLLYKYNNEKPEKLKITHDTNKTNKQTCNSLNKITTKNTNSVINKNNISDYDKSLYGVPDVPGGSYCVIL